MQALLLNFIVMEGPEWKESVRKAAENARDSKLINMKLLAQRCDWPHAQMAHFIEEGTGKDWKVRKLEVELRQLGFFYNPYLDIARRCYVIADSLISSSVPESEKSTMFQSFVNSLIAGVKSARVRKHSTSSDS